MPEQAAATNLLPLTVQFGEPQHGWLPVSLRAGPFCLDLDASDVPVNPLELLCEALAVTAAGGSGRARWFLEPAECWFSFDNQASTVALTITERLSGARPFATTQYLTGTIGQLLVPFYRALQRFTARRYPAKHWPHLDEERVERLGRLLQPYF